MDAASVHDPQCAPNVISYSAVMTACCMGGHPYKAEEWFHHMRARGIAPDHICYSTLIAGTCLSMHRSNFAWSDIMIEKDDISTISAEC